MPEMITINEAARRTGLSYNFLRKACLNHQIIHIRAGNKFLINAGKLTEWLNTAKGGGQTDDEPDTGYGSGKVVSMAN